VDKFRSDLRHLRRHGADLAAGDLPGHLGHTDRVSCAHAVEAADDARLRSSAATVGEQHAGHTPDTGATEGEELIDSAVVAHTSAEVEPWVGRVMRG